MRKTLPLDVRFWGRVDRRGSSECWPWKGRIDAHGYGRLSVAPPTTRLAHRLVWYLTHGEMPKGLVCHTCDNPPCVNPAHLWVGDAAANNWDRSKKGRHPNQAKTHCPQGHEYSDSNTYRCPRGRRFCRTCNRAAAASLARKRKEKL